MLPEASDEKVPVDYRWNNDRRRTHRSIRTECRRVYRTRGIDLAR